MKKIVIVIPIMMLLLCLSSCDFIDKVAGPDGVKFEVGKCYRLMNDDPFQTKRIVIKVLDVKGKYVKYYYVGVGTPEESWSSSSSVIMQYSFREIPCEGE